VLHGAQQIEPEMAPIVNPYQKIKDITFRISAQTWPSPAFCSTSSPAHPVLSRGLAHCALHHQLTDLGHLIPLRTENLTRPRGASSIRGCCHARVKRRAGEGACPPRRHSAFLQCFSVKTRIGWERSALACSAMQSLLSLRTDCCCYNPAISYLENTHKIRGGGKLMTNKSRRDEQFKVLEEDNTL